MADSKANTDLNISILTGSEEIFDFYCQPCSSKRHVEAVGYCRECSEYLCITCVEYHGNLSATKHHKVLDKSAMPTTKLPAIPQLTDVLTEKCHKHPDKVLEYYCKTHSQICCSVCITLDHTSCSHKSYIPDVSFGIDKSNEYKTLTSDLDRLIRELTKRQETINGDSKTNEKYYSKALVEIKEFRKQINELLDKIEDDTTTKVAKFHDENSKCIRSAAENCQSLLTDVKTMSADLEKIAKTGRNNQLFIQVKLSRHQLAKVEKRMNEHGECKMTRYAFYPNEKVQQMMSTLSAMWSLSIRQIDTPTKARFLREVNVKYEGDTEAFIFTGIAILAKDRIAVADFNNMAVKLIDTKMNKVVSSLPMPSKPLDIMVMTANQIAVALGNEDMIGIINVSDVLSMSHIIETPGDGVCGLWFNGSNFITVCQQPSDIKIIDMTGKTLDTFRTDGHGHQLYNDPRYIALDRDKDIFYFTDPHGNALTSMTLSGHAIWVYKHDMLKFPLGVAVGNGGSIYVCSRDTHTIHQLTPSGKLVRIILGRDQGLERYPGALSYDEKNNMLYTSQSTAPKEQGNIRLYQLE